MATLRSPLSLSAAKKKKGLNGNSSSDKETTATEREAVKHAAVEHDIATYTAQYVFSFA
jgi:hypothetical protein